MSFLRSGPLYIADAFPGVSWFTLGIGGPFLVGWFLAVGGLSAACRECLPQFVFVLFILLRWLCNGLNDITLLVGVCVFA